MNRILKCDHREWKEMKQKLNAEPKKQLKLHPSFTNLGFFFTNPIGLNSFFYCIGYSPKTLDTAI